MEGQCDWGQRSLRGQVSASAGEVSNVCRAGPEVDAAGQVSSRFAVPGIHAA